MSNFFTDVIQKDVRYNSTKPINDLAFLEPVTRKAVQKILADAKAHGTSLMVFETFRSQARQLELFNRGASKLRNVGVHHYGLACDIVKDINGEPSWKGSFSVLGQLAYANGLIWGGDWGNPNVPHSFIDSVHVQRCTVSKQESLFNGTWYPDENYNPYGNAIVSTQIVYRYRAPMMRGAKVGEIQTALTKAGFDTKGIDNAYGSDTQKAVEAFQEANGLVVNGEVGTDTAVALGVHL